MTNLVDRPSYLLRQLRDERANHLLALRELDFDYETGKLSAKDYKSLYQKYEIQAVDTTKKLEQLENARKTLLAKIQMEIEKTIGSFSSERKRGKMSHCAQCGNHLAPNDRYCGQCGQDTKIAAHA